MKIEFYNATPIYLETLYKINQNILILCGYDVYHRADPNKAFNIIRDIMVMLPIKKSKKLELSFSDGLLEFGKDVIRKIRNKYVHKPHAIEVRSEIAGGNFSSLDTSSLYKIVVKINEEIISISANQLIELVKDLNSLFSQIVKDIINWVQKERKEQYHYFSRITRFDFEDFNVIYDCDVALLHKIGKLIDDF